MGIERLKTFMLTCDGEVMWDGFEVNCDASTIVQAASKWEVEEDLRKPTRASKVPGWHYDFEGKVLCPRNDHIEP